MAKVISTIQLPGGILLTKTDLVGELLFRASKINFFLRERQDGLFWIIKLPDNECDWDWFDGHLSGRSQTGKYAFYRQENGNIVKLALCIERLVKASATMSPEGFMPEIEKLGELVVVKELEKIAVLYRGEKN